MLTTVSFRKLIGMLSAMVAVGPLWAEVTLPSIFSDNMLVQQGKPILVRGLAAPTEKVAVEFGGQRRETVADGAGKWQVTLDALPTSAKPAEMLVTGTNTITIHNVLVGDLWLASGQSNMQVSLREAENAAQEIAAADFPEVRFYMVTRDIASAPREDTAGKWLVCTPENAGSFSAVAYFFARELHTAYHLPTGVINSAVGSSSCEAWVPTEVLQADKALPQPAAIAPEEYPDWKTYDAVRSALYEAAAAKDPGIKPECVAWTSPDCDTTDWKDVAVPGNIEARGMNIDGAVWFRQEVDVPANWVGRDFSLYLGPISDNDIAFVNGVQVGHVENNQREWVFRTHRVPAKLVKPGRNVIAVRIFNEIGNGGFYPGYPAPLKFSADKEHEIVISGTWKCRVELGLEPGKIARNLPRGHHVPAALYNAMIAPFTATPVRGFIWYQGESNAGRYEQHSKLFPAMIESWRQLWGDRDLPFYFVQLASYQQRKPQPSDDAWAHMRESQQSALALPRTGMAVTIDIGDANNVHPRNKQDVGRRLARWAMRDCYGDNDIEVSGPLYASSAVEGNRIRLQFTHVGGGLQAQGGELKGFAIAGADKAFVWAKASIDGDGVLVWSDAVPAPAFVRYAWATNPECTLFNGAGLPAAPFRTDQ